ncbi:DUF4403 family protein [Nitrospira moscoviensis]|uniref:Lipoprotein n=1 Tax=Nitrospira moscoviensis TaxID=42253 RepID=A0A0K2GCF3_NITMO|nr:DUF4403 family protein [Nitrospira moscoviensis]ALA58628.1 exported protein of unknown function [Nitrospira moscoviensis]
MNSLVTLRALLLSCPLVIPAGCSHTIPSDTPQPQPPPQLGKTPPTIEPLNPSMKQAQAPESLLPVTLTADLSPVQRVIQHTLPERITDETHPLGRDYRWRFIREGDPQVAIQDGLVTFRAAYRGEIESTAARACRLDPLYPVIEGTGRLQLREQDEVLLVTMSRPHTSMTLKPESDSKCNMFNVPVKDQLAELFSLEAVNQQVARAVEEAGYSIPIQLVWDRLQEPLSVGRANQALCLYGKARDFAVGSLKGPAQQTTITGLARQTPVALYQTPCQKVRNATPLKVHLDQQAAATQAGPYTILLTVPVPYAVLNQQLQDRLFHQSVKLPTTFGGDLLIERAAASDVNGRTLLAIDTRGAVNGTLYYWGTPRLEQDGTVISIPDLQMASETKMALDEAKTGYWHMMDQELRDRLRQAVQIDLAQRLANMKSALSGQHKSGGLAMDLLLARQQAAQVTSTKEALVADVLLEGTASAAAQLPVKQQAPVDSGASRSARMSDDRPDDFPERR